MSDEDYGFEYESGSEEEQVRAARRGAAACVLRARHLRAYI